jgi:hypothetical protein
MTQYINKSALVAEIESKRNDYINSLMTEQVHVLNDVLDFLDTLEVKEVDLDNELDFVKDAYYYFTSDERSSMKKVAEHFFELGLKAKGK